MSKSNNLNEAQEERLIVLAEELSEAAQAVMKILRHGYASFNPTVAVRKRISNKDHLEAELGHVLNAIDMLERKGEISEANLAVNKHQKALTVGKYLHHQGE